MPTQKKSGRIAAAAAGTLLAAAVSVGTISPAFAVGATVSVGHDTSVQDEAGLKTHQAKIVEFHQLINKFRQDNGAAPMTFNARAAADAYSWSMEMSKTGQLEHQDGPNDFPGDWGAWGENIAYNYSDSAAEMFTQWKNSPGHRENMLSKSFDSYGIGFFIDKNGRMYGTTVFYGVGWGNDHLPDSYTNPTDYFNGKPELPVDGSVPVPGHGGPFTDVKPGHTFYTPISWLKDEGFTMGYSDGSFGVDWSITRGEAASFLYRISGEKHTVEGAPRFRDAVGAHSVAIDWMAENGYSHGYVDGSFQPRRAITRGEVSSLVYRSSGQDHTAPDVSTFDDVEESSAHYEAIDWLRLNAGITGYVDGTFRPDRYITRGESAKMLYSLR